MSSGLSGVDIHAKLDHPVIDADGHVVEVAPVYEDYLTQVAGPDLRDRVVAAFKRNANHWYEASDEERQAKRVLRPPFWIHPASNTDDLATAIMPNMTRARMDEIGVDVSLIYPTFGLTVPRIGDDEIRQVACRALNVMHADLFSDHSDRLIPAAAIPMFTPDEAVAEIEYACDELGYKLIMLQGNVRRPFLGQDGKPLPGGHCWVDSLGIDSAYDYDPVWAECVSRGLPANMHTGSMGLGSRTSPSSYVFNHIGHFAASHESSCKAMLLGGVQKRFPDLAFGFLEGGVGWATSLYGDLIAHWEKRNKETIRTLDPANIDSGRFMALCEEYALPGQREGLKSYADHNHWFFAENRDRDEMQEDEWAASGIGSDKDFAQVFEHNYYFGCEADDRAVAGAFNAKANPFGARLNAIFSSDIGHWDVPDISGVLGEAHELVDDDLITGDDFRDFVFTNAARLHTLNNPDFFKGTAVEGAVDAYLASTAKAAAAE
jgi:predicted TIM-barrel fold metal-dependent hydrolase